MSKYGSQLVESAQSCTDPVRTLVAKSKLALYLARLDWVERSKDLLKEVRSSASYSTYPSIAAYLNIAEAVIASRSAEFAVARQFAVRAHAISRLGTDTYSETAAWLAHFNQLLRDDHQAIHLLVSAFQRLGRNDYSAAFRACLTLADYLHLVDRFDLARPWYSRARRCAEKSGDDAATAELIYNIAAHGIENTRLREIEGEVDSGQLEFFRVQAESALNYSNLIGVKGEEWQFDLLFVGVHYLARRFEAMMQCCDGVARRDLEKDKLGIRVSCQLDYYYGALKLSRETTPRPLLDKSLLALETTSANEEIALVNYQLHKIFMELGDSSLSENYLSTARVHFEVHRVYQLKLLSFIEETKLLDTAGDAVQSI